ncbi:MAG: sulfite exporter TauE/SafE family protein [Alphaproteobacteria bacterium]|nr:sulfite exporter TauE/SafE family protein [Alphaproteobacteria bacterium]
MSISQFVLLALIGLLAGIAGGMFGIGGAVLVVPMLVFILGYDQLTAQGTTLAMLLPPIGILATLHYYKAGHVKFYPAFILALFFIVGGYFGAQIVTVVNQAITRKIFAIIMILLALKLLFK